MTHIHSPPSSSPFRFCEPVRPVHSRMRKIYGCQYWSEGRCKKDDNCTYVHAFINPEKKGICQRHLKGHCPYDENKCHYMHLPLPLVAYEKLATAAKDYDHLDRLVGKYLERKAKADSASKRQMINHSSSTKNILNEQPSSPKTERTEGESKIEKIPESKATFDPNMEQVPSLSWKDMTAGKPFATQSTKLLDSTPFNSPFMALSTSRVRESAESKFPKSFPSESRITDYRTSKNRVDAQVQLKGNRPWESKPMTGWTPEEVGCFVKSLGTSPCWEKHAKTFVDEQVDGATLFAYKDMTAILEDFDGIKRPHARSMSTAISRLA
mmetsp:Transcript_15580/g.31575  ORF Transcript_15580/g.31575 Transcript_15580/m.31575 type:complete len:324 (-) Transcript_15580:102-1073(-)